MQLSTNLTDEMPTINRNILAQHISKPESISKPSTLNHLQTINNRFQQLSIPFNKKGDEYQCRIQHINKMLKQRKWNKLRDCLTMQLSKEYVII